MNSIIGVVLAWGLEHPSLGRHCLYHLVQGMWMLDQPNRNDECDSLAQGGRLSLVLFFYSRASCWSTKERGDMNAFKSSERTGKHTFREENKNKSIMKKVHQSHLFVLI